MFLKTGIVIDEEGLKTKLRSYRDVYRRELAKVLESECGTGTATDGLYTPKIVWFELADSFLRTHVTIRPARDTIQVRLTTCSTYNVHSYYAQYCDSGVHTITWMLLHVNSVVCCHCGDHLCHCYYCRVMLQAEMIVSVLLTTVETALRPLMAATVP